ncbi:DUF2937 family protein [Psychromonas algicola]|uniref:DUF2937 family protein n=1 Tax=Psychromonas algicola TaxID=2555642 RepID=UPI001068B537|nr:DUF2937 family protein [Psychromonas sp. RZ5]TEW51864.1 DUF2937 family protein [Psychromonas sp. RZ5]
MLAMIKRYCLQILFALSVLFGLQLPHFLQQYELRLQGHFVEANLQLSQYQLLADVHFDGDLDALINQHKISHLALFQDEASIIEDTYLRVQYLQKKINNMNKPIWYRLGLLVKEVGQPIFIDTWRDYRANIVLNQESIIVGLAVAILFMLLLEFFLFLVKHFTGFIFSSFKNKFSAS